jgi:hypothetical protein
MSPRLIRGTDRPTLTALSWRYSSLSLRYDLDRTVIVAVVAVRMVQVAINEIIDMVTVWHHLVATIGAMPVPAFVTAALVLRRTALRVLRTYFQDMFFNQLRRSGADRMMEVSVVEVIDMTVVFDGGVAAV